jgi:hypothetical protein
MNILFKYSFFIVAITFALPGICQRNNYDSVHHYSVDELKSDFQFLRTKLEKTHPNLYLYTSKRGIRSPQQLH